MIEYKIGILGFNPETDRFGLLKSDLWEIEGFHCGDCLDVWDFQNEEWIPTRIEKSFVVSTLLKNEYEGWYLVGTKWQSEDLEGLRIRVEV